MKYKVISISILAFVQIWCDEVAKSNSLSMENSTIPEIYDTKHESAAAAVNRFGYKLLLEMMKQKVDENIILSPTSIAGLLAMTLLGTVGNTYTELADALGFSQDIIENRNNHEQFGSLLRSLNANETSSKTLYSDALFLDKQEKLRDAFRNYLTRVYNGDAINVNFTHPIEAKDTINEWISEHTEGKIENFLEKPLPLGTKTVLLSALYFQGQWEKPFLEDHTEKMQFKGPAREVMADLMLNMGKFYYISSDEYDMHMIAMPYNDSTTTMYALKPRAPRRLSLSELMKNLDSAKIEKSIDEMWRSNCIIRFPKMNLQNQVRLENPLKALGVRSMFTAGQANFALMLDTNAVPDAAETDIISRINDGRVGGDTRNWKATLDGLTNPGLHVDSVIHNVKLTINEYGTEAVAATSGVLARSVKLFYADSPFYMFIRNERTKLVTFSAVIYDPTTV